MLDLFLFGILSVQTCRLFNAESDNLLYSTDYLLIDMFYLAHPKDRPVSKAIVYGVFLVVAAQTALAWHDFYALFCTYQGRRFTSDQNPYRKDLHLFSYTWFTIPASGAIGTIP